ncbi:MAG TPA: arsinothricin resistance N-acetyltransferase ArsN1 family A [Verrucomicrobiae bacterium]|nr:arsinothricin resistance N-acetyltransferase ArsN1 family A [Verrucomicrobiae bacterium]
MIDSLAIRRANDADLEAIRTIYNEGIEDRVATLETDPRTLEDISDWWRQHDSRYTVAVAADNGDVVGWASLNRFSHRCAHAAIADLSVYVARTHRGRGIGLRLLEALERLARTAGFHKIVLHALNANEHGKRLYLKRGFVEVGVFKDHGMLDGRYVDVVAMEKILDAKPK